MRCVLCNEFDGNLGEQLNWSVEDYEWTSGEIEIGVLLKHVYNSHRPPKDCIECVLCSKIIEPNHHWPELARHYLELHTVRELEKALVLLEMGGGG